MGIHICVQTVDHKEHPDWDFCRFHGDRQLPDVVEEVGQERRHIEEFDYLYRPSCPQEFYERMVEATDGANEERWRQLRDILKDEKWWLRYSY